MLLKNRKKVDKLSFIKQSHQRNDNLNLKCIKMQIKKNEITQNLKTVIVWFST